MTTLTTIFSKQHTGRKHQNTTPIKIFAKVGLFVSTFLFLQQNKTHHPISSNSFPSATENKAIHSLNTGGDYENQREHHKILTKYEMMHPTAVSENNSSLGMLIM